MSFWEEVRSRTQEKTTSSDITMLIYKKIASSGINMLSIIKPSFYVGQMSILSYDYISYVEKFLSAEDRDWGEYLKFVLYLREISKRLFLNIANLEGPLDKLINIVEENIEGEKAEDDIDEDPEPEEVEEPENPEEILKDSHGDDEEEDEDGDDDEHDSSSSDGNINLTRDDMQEDYENLLAELRVKIRSAEVPQRIGDEFAREIADVYRECIQLIKELTRLTRYPEGDLSTLITILVDIRYGLCHEMKKHLMEDIMLDERFLFDPGLLTWSAHFLTNFSEKINHEWEAKDISE